MKSALMLGVNPNAIREKNDFYATNPHALEIAMPIFKDILHNNIWECACGQGHLSEVLKDNGYNVKSTDLIDRGYGGVKNFLECDDIFEGDILTNPPYLVTCAAYNEKDGWNQQNDIDLMNLCDRLNDNNVKFAISNVFENKGKSNDMLKEWSNKYNVYHLNNTYANCNYHTKDKSKNNTDEVLITNY